MTIQKLKPSDFTERTEAFVFYYNERDPSTGEDVKRHLYTTSCNVLGRNIKLSVVIDNPVGALDFYLPRIKASLQWAEDNKARIYTLMNERRAEHWFDSDATRPMTRDKFIAFLHLQRVHLTAHGAGKLSMTLLFNELDFCPGTHFAFDVDEDRKYLNPCHNGVPPSLSLVK